MKSGSLRFVIFALLLSVLVRSLVPAGFMPDIGSHKIALTICSGITIKTIMVEDTSAPSGHHQQTKYDTCSFTPPVMADNADLPDVLNYIKISYAAFLPDPTAHLNHKSIITKNIYSQGPPEISVT